MTNATLLPAITDPTLLAPEDDSGFGTLETERGRLPLATRDMQAQIVDLAAFRRS